MDEFAEEGLFSRVELNIRAMALLDKQNTDAYGDLHYSGQDYLFPAKLYSYQDTTSSIWKSCSNRQKARELTYNTHGEMLPAHGYPELKKYKHLV